MANAILNFHFDYLTTSLKLNIDWAHLFEQHVLPSYLCLTLYLKTTSSLCPPPVDPPAAAARLTTAGGCCQFFEAAFLSRVSRAVGGMTGSVLFQYLD